MSVPIVDIGKQTPLVPFNGRMPEGHTRGDAAQLSHLPPVGLKEGPGLLQYLQQSSNI